MIQSARWGGRAVGLRRELEAFGQQSGSMSWRVRGGAPRLPGRRLGPRPEDPNGAVFGGKFFAWRHWRRRRYAANNCNATPVASDARSSVAMVWHQLATADEVAINPGVDDVGGFGQNTRGVRAALRTCPAMCVNSLNRDDSGWPSGGCLAGRLPQHCCRSSGSDGDSK